MAEADRTHDFPADIESDEEENAADNKVIRSDDSSGEQQQLLPDGQEPHEDMDSRKQMSSDVKTITNKLSHLNATGRVRSASDPKVSRFPRQERADQNNNGDLALDEKLPQKFRVKYLGRRETSGIWGIKHTRRPVDELVSQAKAKEQPSLPVLQLTVSEDGVHVVQFIVDDDGNLSPLKELMFQIHTVSYGVQDLVYTRIFAMITVHDIPDPNRLPFTCHAFVCDSRQTARQLTFALAAAFKVFGKSEKAKEFKQRPKKFAIDLRPPDQLRAEMDASAEEETEA